MHLAHTRPSGAHPRTGERSGECLCGEGKCALIGRRPLLLRRCRQGHCEEFCIYRGSLPTYGAVLPPGFAPYFQVGLAVVVQDQLGAAVVALNR